MSERVNDNVDRLRRRHQVDQIFLACADLILQTTDLSELNFLYAEAYIIRCLHQKRDISLADLDADIMSAQIYNANPDKAEERALQNKRFPIYV